MRNALRVPIALWLAILFVCLAQHLLPAQSTGAPATAHASQPAQVQAYTLPPDKLAKAIAINRIRDILDIVAGLWSIVVVWLLLATRVAAGIEAWGKGVFRRRWQQGLMFFTVLLILMILANLPLEILGHSVSRAYGISIEGWGGWLIDQAKALGLSIGLGSPILLLFSWIVRRWPRRYWFASWLIAVPLIVLGDFVSPLFEPIFNQYEPLAAHHAALVAKLETVVARTGTDIPPQRMFLMKASDKTNGLNAYVNGMGATKRIVVWDTTAGRIPDDEVMFIFGHESGHYVLNHIPKEIAGSAIGLFFMFWGCAAFARWLVSRFGANWGLTDNESGVSPMATRAGFVVLIFTLVVAQFVLEPVTNTFSRYFEHQADVYGQEAIHGLVPDPPKTAVAGFQALGEAWLEDPTPSPLVEFWEYNHPSVKTRANFAAQYDPWANGGHGQFFER